MATIKPKEITPNEFALNAEKDSDAYGITIGRFIKREWFNDSTDSFNARKNKFNILKSLKDNTYSTEKFKQQFNMVADEAWAAMDWSYVPLIPKFVNSIVDGFDIDLYQTIAHGIDDVSQQERYDYKKNIKIDMNSKEFTQGFSNAVGIDFTSKQPLPNSTEELDIYMVTDYKQEREIAAELVISNVRDLNKCKETFNNNISDLVVYGICATRNSVDSVLGIKQEYVDPRYFIYDRSVPYQRDKRDARYFAEVKTITINDIREKDPNRFTEKELKNMASSVSGLYGNNKIKDTDPIDNINVEVIIYSYKTTNVNVYKKKYNGNIIKKDQDWTLHESSQSKRMEDIYTVWYEGYYIPAIDDVFCHQKTSNMVRNPNNINQAYAPYSCYEIDTPSLVERMNSFTDDIQVAVLKLRQAIITSKPKGNAIDFNALANISDGSGGLLDPAKCLEIYNQTGDLIFVGQDASGARTALPITEIQNGLGNDIMQFINVYNHNVQMIYDVTGINEVRGGSGADPNMLVGTARIALAQSNTATKHILNGLLSIMESSAEITLARVQQITMYGESLDSKIERAVGRDNKNIIKEAYKLHEHQFRLTMSCEPDAQEMAKFERRIEMAVQSGQITLPDALEIERSANLKLAIKTLKLTIDKNRKKAMDENKANMMAQEQARAQSQIAIQQAEQQATQAKIQMEQIRAQAEAQAKIMIMSKEQEFAIMMENLKHQHNMELEGLVVNNKKQIESNKEDRKDNRTAIQATQQSKMISQRKNDMPATDFESEAEMKAYVKKQQEQYGNQMQQQFSNQQTNGDKLQQQLTQAAPELNTVLPQ